LVVLREVALTGRLVGDVGINGGTGGGWVGGFTELIEVTKVLTVWDAEAVDTGAMVLIEPWHAAFVLRIELAARLAIPDVSG
jgi:hypothetical protein